MKEFGKRNQSEGSIAPIINPEELSKDAQEAIINYEKVWDEYATGVTNSKEIFDTGLNASLLLRRSMR